MKKIAALLLTAVMMLTFSSCASTELELKNRIIVEAIGIDYCDIGVRVTVQYPPQFRVFQRRSASFP